MNPTLYTEPDTSELVRPAGKCIAYRATETRAVLFICLAFFDRFSACASASETTGSGKCLENAWTAVELQSPAYMYERISRPESL